MWRNDGEPENAGFIIQRLYLPRQTKNSYLLLTCFHSKGCLTFVAGKETIVDQ
jgi:hypothetical protein